MNPIGSPSSCATNISVASPPSTLVPKSRSIASGETSWFHQRATRGSASQVARRPKSSRRSGRNVIGPCPIEGADHNAGVAAAAPLLTEAFQVAAETRAFLGERGIASAENQQTKTRKALSFFSGGLKEASDAV